MESNEREPSYYEVALTHRQLMVGLVVALTTVVVAFFAGVWIGRGGGTPPSQVRIADASAAAASAQGTEQLTFFGEKGDASRPVSKPVPIAPKPTAPAAAPARELTPAETEAEALRKTLEAEMAANRVDGDTSPAEAPAPTVAPGARVKRDATESKTVPATSAKGSAATGNESAAPATTTPAAASGTLWIQVYSSTNRERANEISARLKKGGFPVKTLEPGKVGGANYRVRVGPYAERAKADRAASKLRREYKLDTWVTDTP